MSNPLQDRAMLVTLTISQWTARKHDRSISNEVDRNHNAKDGGRYNKLLISKEALDPIAKIEGAARSYFYKVTHAWGDNGERMLPGALFMDFVKEINRFRSEFDAAVRALEADYPRLQQEARKRLGTMYDPADYPASIRDKFSFPSPAITAVPSAKDFRVNLADEYVEQIKAEITGRMEARQQDITKQCWERMKKHVERISGIGDEKAKIFDSVMDNPKEFLTLLPALNLTQDPNLDEFGRELSEILVPADRLRQDKRLRADIAKRADELLKRLPC